MTAPETAAASLPSSLTLIMALCTTLDTYKGSSEMSDKLEFLASKIVLTPKLFRSSSKLDHSKEVSNFGSVSSTSEAPVWNSKSYD